MAQSCRLLRADSYILAVWLLSVCAFSVSVPAIAQSSAAARPNILVIIGDNGTGGNVVDEPFQQGRAKGSVYNGGIAVPFIVTGPGVPAGQISDALVNSTDLFVTILEMAGLEVEDAVPQHIVLDSVSMMPYLAYPGRESIRETIYADNFTTTLGVKSGEYAIRNATQGINF